jgi:hypothetical protein
MIRNSKKNDSEREKNPPAERFFKITSFEPTLGTANKSLPQSCVIGFEKTSTFYYLTS